MASSSGIQNDRLTRRSFEETCEAYSVDSRLLYNDIEQLSNERFRYARQLVSWSRSLAVSAVAAAGVAGLALYYQRSQIHRVWRIRNPHRVRQLSLATTVSGGFSLCAFLFLISPIGPMRLHERELKRMHELDAIAVSALVQEQNFCTLAAWKHSASCEDNVRGKKTSVHRRQHEGTTKGEEGVEVLLETAGQWVWKEVVLDPTQLLSGKSALAKQTESRKQQESLQVEHTKDAKKDGDGAAVRSGMDKAKKKMAAELLLTTSPPTQSEADAKKTLMLEKADVKGGVFASKDSAESAFVKDRRVWARTLNEAELQRILAATIDMWELLVRMKTDILAKVY